MSRGETERYEMKIFQLRQQLQDIRLACDSYRSSNKEWVQKIAETSDMEIRRLTLSHVHDFHNLLEDIRELTDDEQ